MNIRTKPGVIQRWIIIGLIVITTCSSCSGGVWKRLKDDPQSEDSIFSDWFNILFGAKCPDETTRYDLYFLHRSVLDIKNPAGDVFLKFESPDTAIFPISIHPDGTITGPEYPDLSAVDIRYIGWAEHPESNTCVLQRFSGKWQLKAEITGQCKNGKITLHIKEEWIDPVLKSDCGDSRAIGFEHFSAPELTLHFDLNDLSIVDGAEIGGQSPFQADYLYTLGKDQELWLVPLVEEKE